MTQFFCVGFYVGSRPDVIVRPGKGHGWPEMPDEDWPHLVEWFDEHLLNK